MSGDASPVDDPVETLLEEFLERRDAGEAVSVDAFVQAHPEHAGELRLHLDMLDLASAALRPDEPPSADLPAELGPYRLLRELGSGGMGRVFLAECRPGSAAEEGERVALKIVHSHLFRGAGFFKRFLREAELGRRVEHASVVRTLDADAVEAGGQHHHFIVMEYVEGRTLRELADDLGRVPEELCRHIAHEVTAALGSVHAVGAVHRDLKPENVLITADHVVKLMDLGVARLVDEQLRLSQTGAFVGSVHYAAPEQFGGEGVTVDGRTDLHALGILLYELATGRHPFDADDVPSVMRRILDETPRPVGELNPQVSPFFEQVIDRLLEKDPGARFPDAGQLLETLEEGEESAWWRARARELRTQTRRPLRRVHIPRETAVYGRDDELRRLTVAYEQAKAGEGRVVLVEGEAGIGKSRLVDELVSRLRTDGEELGFLFGSYPPGGGSAAGGALSTAYGEHLGDVGSAPYLEQTPLLVPAFDAVIRGEPTPPDALELTKDSLGTCFVHVTRALARESVTVILIDDLHFAPDDARALFMTLALAVPGHRVLLVGTARPGLPEDWRANLTRLGHVERLELDRLGPKDLAELLRDSFQSERLALELAGQIGIKSDGNPFFVFEIIQGLREGQFITQRPDGTWASTRAIGDIAIPSSVLDLVNARVATLDDTERNLLDVAACWGFEFDPTLVGEALGLPRIAALQTLAKIEKRDRLVRSAGRRFVFDHHQVQEALYEELPELLREEYHRALAETLEQRSGASDVAVEPLPGDVCVSLCEHFLRGAGGDHALRYLERAQDHLGRAYLHAQLRGLIRRALDEPGLLEGPLRVRVLLRLCYPGGALDQLGLREQQEVAAREAIQLAVELGDHGLEGRATHALGHLLWVTSRLGEAEAAFRRALELAVHRSDRARAEAAARCGLGLVLWRMGRLVDARQEFESSRRLSSDLGDREAAVRESVNLGLVLEDLGHEAAAGDLFHSGLEIGRELANRKLEAQALSALGNLHLAQRRFCEAHDELTRARDRYREFGDRFCEAATEANLGIALGGLGKLDEQRQAYESARLVFVELGAKGFEANVTGNLALILRREGRLDEARSQLEQQLRIAREIRESDAEAGAVGLLTGAMHELGRRQDALACAEAHLRLAERLGSPREQSRAHHNHGVVLLELGRRDDAARHFEAALHLRSDKSSGHVYAGTHLELGALQASVGEHLQAGASFDAAERAARDTGRSGVELLARCHRALLPGAASTDAVSAYSELNEGISPDERRQAQLLLWKATGDRAHLEEAKRLLDELLAKNPPEVHESMCQNVRANREILAAWREEFGSDDEPGGRESVTRVG